MSSSVGDVESGENVILSVEIPPGHEAGTALTVFTDDGRRFEVVTPRKSKPGERINVKIPRNAEGGSTVIVSEDSSRASLGAAAVGGIVGTLFIGPITGIVLGGALLYATTRSDNIGEAARSAGTITANTYDKAMEAAEKHHVTDRVKEATAATAKRVQQINEEYKITDKVSAATSQAIQGAKELDAKYHITEQAKGMAVKTGAALMSGIRRLTDSDADSKPTPTTAIYAPK